MTEKLVDLIAELKEKEALAWVEKALAEGVEPMAVLGDARRAMAVVGEKFSAGQYFIHDAPAQDGSIVTPVEAMTAMPSVPASPVLALLIPTAVAVQESRRGCSADEAGRDSSG